MSIRIGRNRTLQRASRKLSRHLLRASDYVRVAAWLMRDYAGVVRWRLLTVIAYGAGHIAMKFAAMGVIYLCIHALANDLPVQLPGIDLVSPKSREFVILAVTIGVGLLTAAAFFRYQVRQSAIRLGRSYEEHCARQLIALASRLPDPRTRDANRVVRGDAMHQYPGYARYCSVMVRQLTQLLPAFVSFVAVSLALLWMDFWFTTTLAVMASGVFLAQYPANHRGAMASLTWERTRRDMGRQYVELFRRLGRDPMPLSANSPILDRLFRFGVVRDNMDSFVARASEVERAAFVSRIGSSILLGTALVLLGIDIVEGDRTWAGVVAYLAAVRFALSDFLSVCKITSASTKYHAQLSRYRSFVVNALPSLETAGRLAGAPDWPLEIRIAGIEEPRDHLVVRPGEVIALVMPARGLLRLGHLFDEAIDRSPDGHFAGPVLIDSVLISPRVSLRINLGLPADVAEADLERALAPFAPADEPLPELAPGWLDRAPPADDVLPDWWLVALHVLAVRERRLALVAMDILRYAEMPARWRHACRAALADAVLFLIHARIVTVAKHNERAGVIADGDRLLGWLPLTGARSIRTLAEAYTVVRGGSTGATPSQPVVEEEEAVE